MHPETGSPITIQNKNRQWGVYFLPIHNPPRRSRFKERHGRSKNRQEKSAMNCHGGIQSSKGKAYWQASGSSNCNGKRQAITWYPIFRLWNCKKSHDVWQKRQVLVCVTSFLIIPALPDMSQGVWDMSHSVDECLNNNCGHGSQPKFNI